MERLLKGVEGVISADASFLSGKAVVEYDPGRTRPEAFIRKVNLESPYRASLAGEGSEDGAPPGAWAGRFLPLAATAAAAVLIALLIRRRRGGKATEKRG